MLLSDHQDIYIKHTIFPLISHLLVIILSIFLTTISLNLLFTILLFPPLFHSLTFIQSHNFFSFILFPSFFHLLTTTVLQDSYSESSFFFSSFMSAFLSSCHHSVHPSNNPYFRSSFFFLFL